MSRSIQFIYLGEVGRNFWDKFACAKRVCGQSWQGIVSSDRTCDNRSTHCCEVADVSANRDLSVNDRGDANDDVKLQVQYTSISVVGCKLWPTPSKFTWNVRFRRGEYVT